MGHSYLQIAAEMQRQGYHIDMPIESLRKRIGEYFKKVSANEKEDKSCEPVIQKAFIVENFKGVGTEKKEYHMKQPVGVFSDIHAPFNHPNYLQFIKDTFKQYQVGQVVCLGDLVDHHAISRHLTETQAVSAPTEFNMAKEELKKYIDAFPKLKLCQGNHDDVYLRQAATLGIGEEFLKIFKDLYGLPDTWEVSPSFVIDNVLYKHGLNCAGKDGAMDAAIAERMSTCIGHSHSFGGCKYTANNRSIIFGLNVGCGIDVAAYAFAYGKHAKHRPTLGCGIVFSDSYAIFVPMGPQYFRSHTVKVNI